MGTALEHHGKLSRICLRIESLARTPEIALSTRTDLGNS